MFHIENKSKRDLIQMLVQRGYESDPVKAWKEAQEKVNYLGDEQFPLIDFLRKILIFGLSFCMRGCLGLQLKLVPNYELLTNL